METEHCQPQGITTDLQIAEASALKKMVVLKGRRYGILS